MLELDASISCREAPINACGSSIAIGYPGHDLMLEHLRIGDASIEALPRQHAQLDLRDIEPTPMLRRVVELKTLGQPSCLGSGKGFIERRGTVRIQIVQDDANAVSVRILDISHVAHELRPVLFRPPFGDRDRASSLQRFHRDKDIADPISDVFCVIPRGDTGLQREWDAGLADQLTSCFVSSSMQICGKRGS